MIPLLRTGGGRPLQDSYSRFVARAKRLLPLLALGLLILVVIWPRLDVRFDRFGLIPKIDRRQAHDLRMLKARYTGIDKDNRPFVVTADAAEQMSNDINDLVGLEGPKADLTTAEGGWYEASAFTGTYQPQNKMLDLFGSVALYASRGDEFHTDSARVNLDNSSAEGSEHVTGQGPFGHVDAAGFRIVDHGATVFFTGHTDLYLEPHDKQAAQ